MGCFVPSVKQTSKWDDLRRKAERALGGPGLERPALDETDLLHLVHELEVHQAELEIQGEELRAKNIELKELMHRYADLYHQAPVGFVSLSTRGTIVEANPAASKILGFTPAGLRRRAFSRFIHLEDQGEYFDALTELNRIPRGKAQRELRLGSDSGAHVWASVEVAPLKNDRQEVLGWLVALVDISARKEVEERLRTAYEQLEDSQRQLRGLSSRLISAQEEERKRIAAELHDGLGQTLAALKLGVEDTLGILSTQEVGDGARLLGEIVPTIQRAIDEVRSIYTGLRPAILDDIGVVATIGWFCRQFRAAFPKIHLELVTQIQEAEIPEGLKIVIFRIIQEAMNNVVKHSGAEYVELSLTGSDGGIELCIEDNGNGFDVEKALAPARRLAWMGRESPIGIGLASMKERAEYSVGVISIESVVGEGTLIRVRWGGEEPKKGLRTED